MFSLKAIFITGVVLILTLELVGVNATVGAAVSGAAETTPSTVKLSKRLFPAVLPGAAENSTFNLKLALLSAAAIAEKSKLTKAGSPLFGVTVCNNV